MSNRSAVVISGGVTTRALTPLILAKYDVAVLDPSVGELQHQKYGDKVFSFSGLMTESLQMQAHNEAVRKAIPVLEQWRERFPPQISQSLDSWFYSFVVSNLTRQLLRGFALNVLSEQRDIALFVTHEDVTEANGGLTMWAKQKGIRTLHIPHANTFMQSEMSPDLHESTICDALAVTPHMEQFYRERGFTGISKVTGSPIFDRWSNYRVDRNWAARALGLDPAKPTLTYFSSWSQMTNVHSLGEGFERAYRIVLETAKRDNYQLLIKLHPFEAPGIEQMYQAGAEQHGVDCKITKNYLELCLSCSDVVLSFGPSNTLLDAALLGTQALSIRIRGFNIPGIPEIYLEHSVSEGAEQLGQEIENLLQEPQDLTPAIEQYVGPRDAAKRISEWILKGATPCH